jgi:hypothetical protein
VPTTLPKDYAETIPVRSSNLAKPLALGFAWAIATYLVGGAIATRLGAAPVESRRSMRHVDHHPR